MLKHISRFLMTTVGLAAIALAVACGGGDDKIVCPGSGAKVSDAKDCGTPMAAAPAAPTTAAPAPAATTAAPAPAATTVAPAPAQPAAPTFDVNAGKGAEACAATFVAGSSPELQQAQLLGTGTWGVKGQPSCDPARWQLTGVQGGSNGAHLVAAGSFVFVPQFTRVDDRLHSCAKNSGAPEGGVYGAPGKKVFFVGELTGWVTAETACPK